MLLASPAVADPAPRPVVEQPQRDRSPLKLIPEAQSGQARAAGATAAVPARFDVDGDGRSDMLNREWDGQLYTVLTTDPSPEGAWTGMGGSTVLKNDIVPIGDQDGDGAPEVLTVSKYGQLELFYGANSTYAYHAWTGGSWTVYNKVFSPGDVNGDGRADLMGRQHNGDLYLYLATGRLASPFGPRTRVGTNWGVYDQIVGLGDNDGDGKGDVIARNPAGKLFFYGSTGKPAAPFKPAKQVGTGWDVYNQLFPMDDQNGDGRADLYARDQKGALWSYHGLGDGRLATRVQVGYDRGGRSVDQFSGSGAVASSGKNAFMARDNKGTVYWYGGLNDGRLTARDPLEGDATGADLLYAADLDGDTYGDLLQVYRGTLYHGETVLGSSWHVYNTIVGPGDLNGDGRGDLLARDGSGTLYLHRGNGEGTGFSSRIRIGTGWNAYNRILGAGDYSGDGRVDLLARDKAGDLYLYRGTGSATNPFAGRVRIGTSWNAYGKIVAPGDLNGDNKADLLGVAANGDLYRYLGTGTGAFGPRARIGTGYQVYNTLY
ncbi:FG-GAP repeat domain-containing protein [Streptomyces sp. NPDC001744]|uniref:FG-GAP repeat domain-containing protein n=1 Tax=Streptomyces sp. NPDC001744 TaxID=3364606 RepID=UPI0036ACF106